jgi:chemosensory pili system protein ChpA (sensor histidine kinase/response regulator)
VIMVVDDSLTVRKITSRLLEREGYQVLTAKDGLDAIEQMKDELPALMLVDIEMTRMDCFDLARHLRGDPRTRHLPIIVISSRTAEKHRSQAAQLGVNAFLGKPYPEAELLQHIARYVAAGQDVAVAL